jgi:hypothetical protein
MSEGLQPGFLREDEDLLLTKIKFPRQGETAGRKGYEPGWRDPEKWALLA